MLLQRVAKGCHACSRCFVCGLGAACRGVQGRFVRLTMHSMGMGAACNACRSVWGNASVRHGEQGSWQPVSCSCGHTACCGIVSCVARIVPLPPFDFWQPVSCSCGHTACCGIVSCVARIVPLPPSDFGARADRAYFVLQMRTILYGKKAANLYTQAFVQNTQARALYQESEDTYYRANDAASYDDWRRARHQWDYFYNRH